MYFEPSHSILRPLPSTSGSVTRSQAARSNLTSNEETQKEYTFAPQNAGFNPSLKGLDKPILSTYEEKKNETHQKQSANVPNQQPRCLRSQSKLKDETTVKLTQNELEAQKNTIPKSKPLANQPLKDPKIRKSKIIFSSTTSSSLSDGDTYTKKTSVKKTKTPRKGRKTANTTKKEDNSKSTASTKTERLVDLSNCSTYMQTDEDKPSCSYEMLAEATVNAHKHNAPIKDFITFTPKNPVPKSESSSDGKLRSPNIIVPNTIVQMTPQQIKDEVKKISPRVYLSQGKENTRKEIDEGLLDGDVCDMSVEHFFQRQLDSEIKRTKARCEVWNTILEQTTLPDEIQEAMLAAVVGQTQLLMSQKLQQFTSLLKRCERPETGQALLTLTDLQGFWDMVFLERSEAMMRASLIGNNVDSEDGEVCEADIAPLRPVNLDMPPGKGILKSNNKTATKVGRKVSFKLFNMDTASDFSPTSDDGHISGVGK